MMPTPRVVKNLSNMEIDEISLVDRGANQHAEVAISKRAPEEDQMTDLYHEDGTLLDETNAFEGATVYDDEDNEYTLEAEATEEVEKAMPSFLRGAGAAGKHTGSGAVKGAANNAAAFGRKNKKVIGAGAAGAAAGGAAGTQFGKSFSEIVMEDISKAFSEDDRNEIISKALEAMQGENEQAYAIAKSERDLRLEREYIAKADTYGLPIPSDELGPVLFRMAETMDYDDCSVIAKALDAMGEINGALYEEIGNQGGGANSDVMQSVDALAGEFISKGDGESDISKAQAITGIFDENPDAYSDYLRDQRSGN